MVWPVLLVVVVGVTALMRVDPSLWFQAEDRGGSGVRVGAVLAAVMTGTVAVPTSRIVQWAVTGGLPVDVNVDRNPGAGSLRAPTGRIGRR